MSKLKFPHASGNSMSIGAPATNPASDLELKLPATIGTAGQVLQNSSTPGTLEFGTISAGLSRTTASASTSSGTEVEFTSLDADSTHHRIIGYGVSFDSNVEFRMQAGTSSAYLTSGYKTSCGYFAGGASTGVDGDTGYIRSDGMTTSGNTEMWTVDFYRAGTTNSWVVRGWMTESGTNYLYWTTSNFDLSAALNKIKVYPSSGNFDAGNIYLESFK